jgi:hypothetical protein
MVNKNRLINLVNDINTTRKDLSKMETNLPAKLMQINIKNNIKKHKSKYNNKHKFSGKPQVYAKSVSSTFSSVMHNDHTHTQGKTIVNESNKPYIKIDEIQNGDVQHYMIPKNSIPYKPNKLQIKLLSPQHPTMHHPTMHHPTMAHSTKTKHTKKHHTKKHHTKKHHTKKHHTKKHHTKK